MNKLKTSKKTKQRFPCPWLSCHSQPKTLSFRTISTNPVFVDSTTTAESIQESRPTNSPDNESEHQDGIETTIQRLKFSERLFLDMKGTTRSILEETQSPLMATTRVLPVISENPFGDFRRSMEEMVRAHGLDAMDELEELLRLFLEVNPKENHGFVFSAFVDLLRVSSPCCDCHQESLISSPLSFCESCSVNYSDESSS